MHLQGPDHFCFIVGVQPCSAIGIDPDQFRIKTIPSLLPADLYQFSPDLSVGLRSRAQSPYQRPDIEPCSSDYKGQLARGVQPVDLRERDLPIPSRVEGLIGISQINEPVRHALARFSRRLIRP